MARFIGPRAKKSMNAATEVATPMMVRTPLGTSSMYTPGKVGLTGIGVYLLSCAIRPSGGRNDPTLRSMAPLRNQQGVVTGVRQEQTSCTAKGDGIVQNVSRVSRECTYM